MVGTRADAESFCRRWAGRGDENQDTQRFWIDLFQSVLGLDDAVSRLRFEVPVATAASEHVGYADVLVPLAGVIVEQKSLGVDLSKEETRQGRRVTPAQQALAYARGMPLSQQPRYVIACNFAEMRVYDRNEDALCRAPRLTISLADLPKNLPALQFLKDAGEKDVLVSLKNFHGIELEDFACCVARTALWIAEKQADADTAKITQRVYQSLPLTDYACVVQGNALAMDWEDVEPAADVDFVIGNPPFLGASNCSAQQKAEVRDLFGGGRLASSLDYVSGWYVKAARLMQANPAIRAALVSTNSICQGEQVAPIWGELFGRYGVRIDFAWDTFFWASEADDPAHVHCVIVGFSAGPQRGGTLYDPVTGVGRHLSSFSPYRRDLPLVLMPTRSRPICDVPKLAYGNKPTDGGNFILTDGEKDELLARWPQVAPLVRRYVGAEDFLHGRTRWCLWMLGADMALLRSCPEVVARVGRVRELRLASSAADTRRRAEAPWEFFRTPVHDVPYLAVPRTSSERRSYLPIGYFSADTIPSDATSVVADASLYHFGVLSSSAHMAWTRVVCGRLKSDYRYSGGIVYNNFPWPEPAPEQRERIEACAREVLDARAACGDATLAQMYDPDLAWSFSPLMEAHRRLDDAVLDAYGPDCDRTDEESIVRFLFHRYEELTK